MILEAIENYPSIKAENIRDNTFDVWHKELCDGIKKIGDRYCNIFSGDGKNVTYGQCQKWINMTIKYMRLMGILPDKIKLKDIHIPIDNYVLNAASIKGAILESDGVEGLGVINTLVNGWSRIDCYEEYLNFQKSVLGSFLYQKKSAVEWEDEARLGWQWQYVRLRLTKKNYNCLEF